MPYRMMALPALAWLLMSCEGLTIPSGASQIPRPPSEISAPCFTPAPPRTGTSADLQRALVSYANALADCSSRKEEVQRFYEDQIAVIERTLNL